VWHHRRLRAYELDHGGVWLHAKIWLQEDQLLRAGSKGVR
jgi:hypothetical protein